MIVDKVTVKIEGRIPGVHNNVDEHEFTVNIPVDHQLVRSIIAYHLEVSLAAWQAEVKEAERAQLLAAAKAEGVVDPFI